MIGGTQNTQTYEGCNTIVWYRFRTRADLSCGSRWASDHEGDKGENTAVKRTCARRRLTAQKTSAPLLPFAFLNYQLFDMKSSNPGKYRLDPSRPLSINYLSSDQIRVTTTMVRG